MMMPSIFGENLFDDDWMNFPFEQDFWGKKNPLYGKHAKNMMRDMKSILIFRDLRKMRSALNLRTVT